MITPAFPFFKYNIINIIHFDTFHNALTSCILTFQQYASLCFMQRYAAQN